MATSAGRESWTAGNARPSRPARFATSTPSYGTRSRTRCVGTGSRETSPSAELERVIDALVTIAPSAAAIVAMITLTINLWLAARITATSGRLRSDPDRSVSIQCAASDRSLGGHAVGLQSLRADHHRQRHHADQGQRDRRGAGWKRGAEDGRGHGPAGHDRRPQRQDQSHQRWLWVKRRLGNFGPQALPDADRQSEYRGYPDRWPEGTDGVRELAP